MTNDKVVIVTGGNRGLGAETVKQLVEKGVHVVMTARSVSQGTETAQRVLAAHPAGRLEVMALDLASLSSVRAFAAAFLEKKLPLHALVNNAGLYSVTGPRQTTADGFEAHFGTNHLGHFLLTHLLLDALLASGPSRVVTVSSALHKKGNGSPGAKLDFDDLQLEKRYDGNLAYANSKLANVLFAYELDRRLKARGLTSNVVTPMMVPENLVPQAKGFRKFLFKYVFPLMPFARTNAQAAANTVFATLDPALEGKGGQYLEDLKPSQSSPESHDAALAAKLWDASLKLCGIAEDRTRAA